MAIITVSSAAQLQSAIKGASGGDVIQLASGDYGKLSLGNLHFARDVTIISADPDQAAVLSGLKISGSSGISVRNVEFALDPADKYFPITVGSSKGIHFSGLNVHGLIDGDPTNDAMAMMIRESSDVSVTGSRFEELHHAVNFVDSDHVTVSDNSFRMIRTDGVRGGGTSDLVIANNYFTDFHPYGADHPDAIQLWTTNTSQSARNISITGNVVERGNGDVVQGIFLRDQSGGKLPYQDVTISDNIVLGTMYNGISVGNVNGLVMTGNTVGAYADQKSWLRIESSTGVTLKGNAASAFVLNNDSFIANSANVTTGALGGTGGDLLKNWLDSHRNLWDHLNPDLLQRFYPDYSTMLSNMRMLAAHYDHDVAGTAGADRLYVDPDGATHLRGLGGDDVLVGGAAGSRHANLLEGGAGNDVYVISSALDHVMEAAGGGIDEVQSRIDYVLGANVENLRLLDGATAGTGNDLSNTIRGNDMANILKGMGGDDLIYGGGGNDRIDGGAGNDRIYGDAGNDIIHGGNGNDMLYGGDGDDIIYGDAGNDLIEGGAGSDILYGGAGADQFSYRPEHLLGPNAGIDTIADFSSAQGDRILLAMLDANSRTPVNDKFDFIGQAAFSHMPGELNYHVANGNAYVCGDVNGDGIADFTICVAGVTSLSASDFSL